LADQLRVPASADSSDPPGDATLSHPCGRLCTSIKRTWGAWPC